MKKKTRQNTGLIALASLTALISVTSLAGCGSATAAKSQDETAPFVEDRVVEVRFVMTVEDWTYLQKNAREESYVQADMWYDGELIPDIAVRPKGNSSLSSTISSGSIKFGLKADLNFFNAANSLDGVKKLNFNNGFSDPTFIKEKLSYELFEQMGLPTPRSSFVDVWVNDTHLGLYTMVEQVDQAFLARYFTDTTGNLYKPESPAALLAWTEADVSIAEQAEAAVNPLDINIGGGNLEDIMKALGEDTGETEPVPPAFFPNNAAMPQLGNIPAANITRRNLIPGFPPSDNFTLPNLPQRNFQPGNFAFPGGMFQNNRGSLLEQMGLKTNENSPDYTGLYRLLEVLNDEPDATFVTEIEKVLDVDQVLRYIAVSTVLVHLDNYTGMGHNYYLYEIDGKFTIIPWDLNMSFGGFNSGLDKDGIINFLIYEPVTGGLSSRPLVARLLAVPEYLELYHGYLAEMISGPFSSEAMQTRIDTLAGLIRSYVAADTLKFFSTAAFEQFIGEEVETASMARGMGMGLNIGLKLFVTERIASIEKQLSGILPSTNGGKGNGSAMIIGGR